MAKPILLTVDDDPDVLNTTKGREGRMADPMMRSCFRYGRSSFDPTPLRSKRFPMLLARTFFCVGARPTGHSTARSYASVPPTTGSLIEVPPSSTVSSVPGSGHNVNSRSLEKIMRPIFCPAGIT